MSLTRKAIVRIRGGIAGVGMVTFLLLASPGRAESQSNQVGSPVATPAKAAYSIPETTIMAVLATSLVGLVLAGWQKRRKG